jgi:hypothetical protein
MFARAEIGQRHHQLGAHRPFQEGRLAGLITRSDLMEYYESSAR